MNNTGGISEENTNRIFKLITQGYTKRAVHDLMDGIVGYYEVERAFRSFMMDDIVRPIKNDKNDKTEQDKKKKIEEDKKRKIEVGKRLAEKMQEKKSERILQPKHHDQYTYFIMKVMEGNNLQEIKEKSSGPFRLKMDEVFQKFNLVVDAKKKEYYLTLDKYEQLSELLKAVNRRERDLNSSMARVKRAIYPKKITCEYGKIENIIYNAFDGNKYKAYYIFSRMKKYGKNNKKYLICFGQRYDQFVFDRIKRETEEALYGIANEIRALDTKTEERRQSRITELIKEMESGSGNNDSHDERE